MTAVAELISALMGSGMEAADAAALVARAGAELSSGQASKAALRTRRWRERKASQTVTERHAVTPETPAEPPSPNVTNRHKPSLGDGLISTSSSVSNSEDSSKKENKREKPKADRSSRIPDDWSLTQREIDYAISKGVKPERIPIIGEKFKNHWLASGGKNAKSTNWFLKWCTWVMNEMDWNAGRTNGAHAPRPGSREDTRERTVNALRSLDPFARSDEPGPGESAGPAIPRQLSFVKPA